MCNPLLADLISEKIGEEWPVHLDQLKQLKEWSKDAKFQDEVMKVKQNNKNKLAEYLKEVTGVEVNPCSLFDIQVKRIHEYKRQLLNILHVVTMYTRCRDGNKIFGNQKLTVLSCVELSIIERLHQLC